MRTKFIVFRTASETAAEDTAEDADGTPAGGTTQNAEATE